MWLARCRIHITSLTNFGLQALNHIGLRVVMDVVYNHLNSSGPFGISSVLDKVINSNVLFMSTATKRTSIVFLSVILQHFFTMLKVNLKYYFIRLGLPKSISVTYLSATSHATLCMK